jgi:hypothetical protein
MLTQDEGQTPSAHGRWPQRDRVRKVGRIGSLLCTLMLIFLAVLAVGVSGAAFYFGLNDPRTMELRGIFVSAGVRNPAMAAMFLLMGATWVYGLWILRRLFLEFSRGIVFSVRNARAICWLGVLTIFGMFSFNPSNSQDVEVLKGQSKTEAPAENVSEKVAAPVNERAPRVGFSYSIKTTVTSAGKETNSKGALFENFTIGFDFEYLLVGLLLLAVGWGLEQGVALQEEQDLTI